MRSWSKRFFAIDYTETSARELIDVLVLFSIVILIYEAIADWGGLSVLQRIVGTQFETPSFLYFFGVALAAFSVRRIADQRRERKKRNAGGPRAHDRR